MWLEIILINAKVYVYFCYLITSKRLKKSGNRQGAVLFIPGNVGKPLTEAKQVNNFTKF